MKWIRMVILTLFFFQSCSPFTKIPKSAKEYSEIKGIYSNDCDSVICDGDARTTKVKLWDLIDKNYKNTENSLLVKFELIQDKKLKVQLIRDTIILEEKIIKGNFNKDNCYYTQRKVSLIPILPILWFYSSRQDRIYYQDNVLVYEYAHDDSGVAIIMASGANVNYKWLYRRIKD